MADKDKPKPAEIDIDPMEQAKRIMKRLAETPHQPHQPLGKRLNSPSPKTKERPASKGRVHKGKTRN
jgi:hypothetical protein